MPCGVGCQVWSKLCSGKKITGGTFWSGDRWVGRRLLTAKIEKVGDGGDEKWNEKLGMGE